MNQKSYEESSFGKLYLVPTPIGNMEDITLRALNILKEVDIIYAEDTRETLNLLKKYNITKKTKSCHKYSEMKNKDNMIDLLKKGNDIAYVTDRGTPLISDPGNIIVEEAIQNNISVIALPGPNAVLPAINMSGLDNQRFLFYGFLNSKKSIAKKELQELKNIKQTIIFYESPFRIKDTISLLFDVFGDRKCSIVREISKLHEEIIRSDLKRLQNELETLKGEIVIVVEGKITEEDENINYVELVNKLLKKGYTKRDAVLEISKEYNISKNELYNKVKEK